MKTLLHVGCGSQKLADLPPLFSAGDWEEIRYDIDPAASPDIVGTVQDMSLLESGVMDAVYSSHNIEHVWEFEVRQVLGEFLRVLHPAGFLAVSCPDIEQVAQAVLDGKLDESLYTSPAGPITAIDILYGHQPSIAAGNEFMAHKMAFTAQTLARHLLAAGFASVVVQRQHGYGMHAVATKQPMDRELVEQLATAAAPQPQLVFESISFGTFEP